VGMMIVAIMVTVVSSSESGNSNLDFECLQINFAYHN